MIPFATRGKEKTQLRGCRPGEKNHGGGPLWRKKGGGPSDVITKLKLKKVVREIRSKVEGKGPFTNLGVYLSSSNRME